MLTPHPIVFKPEVLLQFTQEVFRTLGVPAADARIAAAVLSLADLRGVDSHGVARLETYVDLLQEGRINPNPKIQVVRGKKSICTIDGDNGLGLVAGPKALEIIIETARKHGSAWASVRNTNHFGIAGYYSLEAIKHDMLGIAMTNSTKLVAPLWGAERMLGTNPIAIAFPGKEQPPVVIDLATSAAAYGKIEIARRNQGLVPDGWIIDKSGRPSTHPQDMVDGGALLPLGSTRELGGHKGYALSAMVDILTSVLSGANWGPFAPPFALRQEIPDRSVGKGIGHFFGVMEIEGFMDVEEFKSRMDEWILTFRKTKPAPGQHQVLIPGDPERWEHEKRLTSGVPISEPVVEDLKNVSKKTGVYLEIP